jgi:hypothetical protein
MESEQKKRLSVELKPNTKKVFLSNFLKVISTSLLIAGVFCVTVYIIGIETLLMPFDVFGIEVETSKIALIFLVSIFAVAFFASLLNYFSVKGIKYVIFSDKILVYRVLFFWMISSKEVSYENVIRVSYTNNGFFNKIFNSGSVVLDLSGLKEREIKLEFIDEPLEISRYIQTVVNKYKKVQQAIFDEKHKVESILNQI